MACPSATPKIPSAPASSTHGWRGAPAPHGAPLSPLELRAVSPAPIPAVPVGELCRPEPACRPGGSSGCSRRRTRRGGRGRRGAAKALPWCRVPGEAAPAASGPVLRELLFMLPSPLPRGGGGGRRGMGWVVFFCCFSILLLFFFFPFPKSHPSKSVIEMIQCSSAQGW